MKSSNVYWASSWQPWRFNLLPMVFAV